MTYPHWLWTIDGLPVVVTGDFIEHKDGRQIHGYDYYREDSPTVQRWITTEGARIRARMRSEAHAQQVQEASPNDASSGPQSEVRQEDGNSEEGGEGIRPSRQAQGPLNRHTEGEAS